MLVTDVRDDLCWWQFSDLNDQFIDDRFLMTDWKFSKIRNRVTRVVILSPTRCHQHSVTNIKFSSKSLGHPMLDNCSQSNFRFSSQNFTVAIFHISFSKYFQLYKMLYDSYIQAYLIFPSSVSVFHLIQPTQDWTGWKRFSSFSWFW